MSTVEKGGGSPNPAPQDHGDTAWDTNVTRAEVGCGTQLQDVVGYTLRIVIGYTLRIVIRYTLRIVIR